MDIEVVRTALTQWRQVDLGSAPLIDGQVRLKVDRFGFSSNNVTYAVMGEMLRYWEAFSAAASAPSGDVVWGRVPVWGFAEVVESRVDAIAVGERLFGFLPMSTELVITPGKITETEIADAAPHRAVLAAAYNNYRRCAKDPTYDAGLEDLQMLLYPLYFTSFVIDDFLVDHADFGASQVIISSASAKTAIGAAQLLHGRSMRTVALTSEPNVEFCESLGVYDQVLTYDEITDLEHTSAVFVDVAGNPHVVAAVHRHLAEDLVHSMVVGDTHWDSAPAETDGPLPGPPRAFLFAPTQIKKRSQDWGAAELNAKMGAAWATFAAWASTWLDLERVAGPEAVIEVFLGYLAGRVDPKVGTLCTMRTQEVAS